jgi:cold shock CspA family protein
MTEAVEATENTMQEFGSNTGQVVRFFNRKGYGFIKDLNDDKDFFVHNTDIILSNEGYRKLYPGEYVSYNLVERDGKQVCSDVRGVMGYPLLVENAEHTYRVYPKHNSRLHDEDTPRHYSSNHDSCSSSDSDQEPEPEPEKEVINKEAPEGIEVADFDGLNINEEMS